LPDNKQMIKQLDRIAYPCGFSDNLNKFVNKFISRNQ